MPTAAQLDLSITATACKDNLQPALKQVLIVDDDQHLLHSIQVGLENNSSLRVRTAADGKEVLDIIDSGGLDLVVIDLNMPDMDVAALSESFPKILSIIMLEWQDFTLSLKEYSPLFPELRINSALAYLLLQTSCRLDQHRHSQACLNRARKELRRRQRRDNAEHS